MRNHLNIGIVLIMMIKWCRLLELAKWLKHIKAAHKSAVQRLNQNAKLKIGILQKKSKLSIVKICEKYNTHICYIYFMFYVLGWVSFCICFCFGLLWICFISQFVLFLSFGLSRSVIWFGTHTHTRVHWLGSGDTFTWVK